MQIALPTLCHVALLAVVLVLLRPLPVVERWLGLAAIAGLSHTYGGLGIFAFAERFLTARTLAEPLALGALALLVYNRIAWGVLAILAAAALHPLVALPAVVVGWVLLVQQDRRWAWLGLLALLPLFLAWSGRVPFNALLQTYDEEWWQLVDLANTQVLLSRWTVVDWQIVVLDLAVLTAAARILPQPLRRLVAAIAIATMGLLLVSVVGADWWRNVLITQLQVWRVLWLAHVLSLALLPAVASHLWRYGPKGRLAMLALAAAVIAINGSWEWGWVFLAWTAVTVLLLHYPTVLRPSIQQLAAAATLLAVLGLSVVVALRVLAQLGSQAEGLDVGAWLLVFFTMPAVSMLLAVGLFVGFARGRVVGLAALSIAVVAFAVAAASWDRRTEWIRYVETGLQRSHPFAALIPETAQVYWHDELASTWLLLRRPNYYSQAQGAGLLFNRNTAMEFGRRHAQIAPLSLQSQLCRLIAALDNGREDPSDCLPSEEFVEELCAAPERPDFMVFQRRLTRGVVASWTFNPGADTARTFHLYDCQQFR